MIRHLHLIGGTGRIGVAIIDSLKNSNPYFSKIWVYCDGQKAAIYNKSKLIKNKNSNIEYSSYSEFGIQNLISLKKATEKDEHLFINLRGVNNKKFWLTTPLFAIDLNNKSCEYIIDSDIWMYPNIRFIHLSSKLCEFLEGNYSINQICEGHDSYRHAYVISRLHQEVLITAHSYECGMKTNIIRLPAIYGYKDDHKVNWVLNSFIKEYLIDNKISPKNPQAITWITHHKILTKFLKENIFAKDIKFGNKTVEYINIPSLEIKVKSLAKIIEAVINENKEQIEYYSLEIIKEQNPNLNENYEYCMSLLIETIREITKKQINLI